MRFKFAVESDNEADLVAMQRAMQVLGEGTITAQPEPSPAPKFAQIQSGSLTQSGLKIVQLPQNTEANGEDAPTPPKRRGRPPGFSPKRAKAEQAARAAESAPQPEPESESESESAPAWTSELADETVLKTVTDFVKQNRPLSGQVGNLLRQYECERVTQLPVERRAEFLSELRNLAALQ